LATLGGDAGVVEAEAIALATAVISARGEGASLGARQPASETATATPNLKLRSGASVTRRNRAPKPRRFADDRMAPSLLNLSSRKVMGTETDPLRLARSRARFWKEDRVMKLTGRMVVAVAMMIGSLSATLSAAARRRQGCRQR